MAEEKILDSEKLDEEQLDNVAGGTMWQMEDDINRFKSLGVLSPSVAKHDKDAIEKAFAAYGIKAEAHGGIWSDNQYYFNGKQISRNEAWEKVRFQSQNYRPQVK